MFGNVEKKIIIAVLSNIVNVSNHTKCVALSNQKRMIHPTLINLHRKNFNTTTFWLI